MVNDKCHILRGLLQLTDLRGFSARILRILLLEEPKTRKVQDFCHQFDLPPCGISKTVFCKEGLEPCFSGTFNIIIRHIFLVNVIEIPQVVRKI